MMQGTIVRQSIIIVDIDGTVAHSLDREWHEFDKVMSDTPDHIVIGIVSNLVMFENFEIIFVTGRSEDCRAVTEEWLEAHCPPYRKLLMRASKDYRADSIVKRELYEAHIKDHFHVYCVFDDRNQVVEMWREEGLKCFQVAVGDF